MSKNDEQTQCGYLMKQITDGISKISNNQFRKCGLTLRQIRVLNFLYHQGQRVPLKQLEAQFHISQPTVAGITQRLAKKKLIVLKVSTTNGSAKTASLTEAGKKLYLESNKYASEMEVAILSGLDPKEVENLQQTLEKVLANIYRL